MAGNIRWLLVGVLTIAVWRSHARPVCQVTSKQGGCTNSLARMIVRNNGSYLLLQFEFAVDVEKPGQLTNHEPRRISLKAVTKYGGEYTAGYLDKCLDPEKDDIAIPLKLFRTDADNIPASSIQVYLCTGETDCINKDCQDRSACCDHQCDYRIDTSNCPISELVKSKYIGKTEKPPTAGARTMSHPPSDTKNNNYLPSGSVVAISIVAIAALGIVAITLTLGVVHQRRNNGSESDASTNVTVRIFPVGNVQSLYNVMLQFQHIIILANQMNEHTRFRVKLMVTVADDDLDDDHDDEGQDTQRLTGIPSLFRKVFFNRRLDNDIYIILCPRGTDLFRDDNVDNLLQLSSAYLSPRQHNGEIGADAQVLCSLLDYRFGVRGRTIIVEENESETPNQDAPDGYKYLMELSSHAKMRCGRGNDNQEIADLLSNITNPPEEEPIENDIPIAVGNGYQDTSRNEGEDAAPLLPAPDSALDPTPDGALDRAPNGALDMAPDDVPEDAGIPECSHASA